MKNLYDQYRPSSLSEVCGQDLIVRKITALSKRGLSGRAYWITGQSGTGKTTLAHIIAGEVADPFNVIELDASLLTPKRLSDLEDSMACYALGEKHGRAYIVNEAHGLSKSTVRQLLVLLERIPEHVVMIFTTTNDGAVLFEELDDSSPLISRCLALNLARRGLAEPFATRCLEIAESEGLGGSSQADAVKLARKHNNNFRAMLQAVELGELMAS